MMFAAQPQTTTTVKTTNILKSFIFPPIFNLLLNHKNKKMSRVLDKFLFACYIESINGGKPPTIFFNFNRRKRMKSMTKKPSCRNKWKLWASERIDHILRLQLGSKTMLAVLNLLTKEETWETKEINFWRTRPQ